MECNLELKRVRRGQKTSEVIYSHSSHQACQGSKLGDRFKLEKMDTFSSDFHKVVKSKDIVMQKSKAFHHNQQPRSKVDELVRYMSSLPSYLEKGENHQEKAFNVGVLEWRRLEKWQYNHRQVSDRVCKSSPSNNNALSLSSTEVSSSNSGRGHSCSPASQRMVHSSVALIRNSSPNRVCSPSIKSHEQNGGKCQDLAASSSFSSIEGSSSDSGRGHSCSPANHGMRHSSTEPNRNLSPSRVCSRGIKSFERKGGKFQDLAANSSNYVKVSQSILSTHKCFNKYTDNQLKECKNNDRNPLCISEKRESQAENSSSISGSKGKIKLNYCEPLEVKQNLQNPCCNHNTDLDSMERGQPLVLLQPKDGLGFSSPAASKQSDSIGRYQQGTTEASRQSFSDISNYDAFELPSDMPHSCPLPREANTFMKAEIEQSCSTTTKSIRSPELLPCSRKFSVSPGRDKNLKGKKLIKTLDSLTEASNLKTGEDSKARNPSPLRRLMGRINRNSSAEDTSCVHQGNPDSDKFRSTGGETSVSSFSNATGKGRSSPLRRLLDPLLKPRASNFDNSIGSVQRDASPMNKTCKLPKGQEEYATRHSVKVKLDLGSCKTTDVDHPQDIGKCGQLTVQALFQVAVKNGLPLFTFAVDNSSDILAATMRKLSSGKKNGNSWMYTFFTIHEMKKKNGSWLNHGNKDRTHGYIPNVVAQMKVSDVALTDLIRPNSLDQCIIREFVLVSTKKRPRDDQISDLQANDELAAIVLKLPKMAMGNLNEGDKMCKVQQLSMMDLKGPSQAVCRITENMHLEESGSSVRNQNHFDLAVILPGGDHGLPSEGEPSPLIERWRSGGSCDCGGWDLGCSLKILGSQNTRASASAKSQFSNGKFQLHLQEQGLNRKPIFSLSPFKDGIYSVEFDSSLKLLQAFSMCIAVLNGSQPAKFSEFGNCFEKKSSEETILAETDGSSVNRDQEEHSASNASYSTISPV